MSTCITDLANEIWFELGEPDDISIPAIAFWLRSNIGKLNIKIAENFDIVAENNYEFTPELTLNTKEIFKSIFYIWYFDKQIRKNLGAAALNQTIEVDSDGSKVRKTSKNDTAKLYLQMKEMASEDLDKMVNAYKFYKARPSVVHGQDGLYLQHSWQPYFNKSRLYSRE